MPTARQWPVVPARAADSLNDFRRKAKAHILRHHFNFFDAAETIPTQIIYDILDQNFGSRGSGRNGNISIPSSHFGLMAWESSMR